MATGATPTFPPVKVPLLADAVNDACDALDGVKDGVLNDPRRCHFDPGTLLCKGADALACLTAPQVCRSQQTLDRPPRLPTADQIYPGLVPGGEAGPGGWTNWITGTRPARAAISIWASRFFRYMLFDNPDWDYQHLPLRCHRRVRQRHRLYWIPNSAPSSMPSTPT